MLGAIAEEDEESDVGQIPVVQQLPASRFSRQAASSTATSGQAHPSSLASHSLEPHLGLGAAVAQWSQPDSLGFEASGHQVQPENSQGLVPHHSRDFKVPRHAAASSDPGSWTLPTTLDTEAARQVAQAGAIGYGMHQKALHHNMQPGTSADDEVQPRSFQCVTCGMLHGGTRALLQRERASIPPAAKELHNVQATMPTEQPSPEAGKTAMLDVDQEQILPCFVAAPWQR